MRAVGTDSGRLRHKRAYDCSEKKHLLRFAAPIGKPSGHPRGTMLLGPGDLRPGSSGRTCYCSSRRRNVNCSDDSNRLTGEVAKPPARRSRVWRIHHRRAQVGVLVEHNPDAP